MGGEAHRQGVMCAAQPARHIGFGRHQISNCLRTIAAQNILFVCCEWLQIRTKFLEFSGDQDQPFVLWPSLEFQQFLYGTAIARIATQAITIFSGVGDQSAASQVCGNVAERWGGLVQLFSGRRRYGVIPNIMPHLAAIKMDGLGNFISAFLRHFHHRAQRGGA